MKVNFCPKTYQPTGTISFLSWTDPKLRKAIRQAFYESSREDIVEIVVEREGIKAIFKTK